MANDKARVFSYFWLALGNGKEPKPEYYFHPTRRWRFDFAFIFDYVAIEIDGGVWSDKRQGHTWGTGFESDCEKLNEAAILGWTVLRFTPQMLEREPQKWIDQVLKAMKSDE